jgi:DNA polymerase III sliding clamp (beta) subunit (PCNA family)
VPRRASNHQGPDFVIGVNRSYLEDAIGEHGVRSIRFGDELSPMVISDRNDEHLAVVMPMRL